MRIAAHLQLKKIGMSDDLLEGWKEIAAYLGVSVRKAQQLEKADGLPVLRLGEGKKPRVAARRSELDTWLHSQAAHDTPTSEESSPKGRRRGVVLGAIAMLLLVVGAVWWAKPGPTPIACIPSRVQRIANTIKVVNNVGRGCWTQTFPPVLEPTYASYETSLEQQRRGRASWVADIDSDGEPEVLFVHLPRSNEEETSTLHCFDATGRTRWTFAFGRAVTVSNRFFAHAYEGSIIGLAQHGETRFLVALGTQQPFFPTQVVLLDPRTGTLVDEYWHPGRFYATKFSDLDNDGTDELLLAGINNPDEGLGHATFAVLNIPFDKGDLHTPDYFGNPGSKERAYLLFPRPRLFEVKEMKPSAFGIAVSPNGRLHVDIGGNNLHKIVYAFDHQLELQGVHPSDDFRQRHADEKLDFPAAHERAQWHRVLRFPTAPDGNDPAIEQRFRAETQAAKDVNQRE